MRVRDLNAVADCKTEVFFVLTPEGANTKTLFREVGWIYAAILSNDETFGERGVHYYQYPYAYLGIRDGKPYWNMVSRPWCDFEELVLFTTLEEAIEFESQQQMSIRKYNK